MYKKISGQGSHASSSTPQGRSLVDSLGGAAAPKFLKNWLTFAHRPYDPDHKSALRGPPADLRGSAWRQYSMSSFSSGRTKTWESF